MKGTPATLVLAITCLAVGTGAAQSAGGPRRPPPGQRCRVRVLNVDRDALRRDVFNNESNINYDAGGNVRLRCESQNVFLDADSISALSGDYLRMYGKPGGAQVVYRDTSYRFTADTLLYIIRAEKVEARGHVRVLDKSSGSTLVGPSVDYWRAVKGINDSARVEAIMHPTVRYFVKDAPVDTLQRPYILSGRVLKGFGQSRLWGSDSVTIERDSLHGAGDSLSFERGKSGVGELIGKPATLRRTGADSFAVFGRTIRLGLDDDRVRDLRAFLDARVKRGPSDIAGDTIHLNFSSDKLALTQAWARQKGATLRSAGYDVRGDSLAVDSPDEQLREVRVFRRGMIQNPRDSAVHAGPAIPGDTTKADTTRNTLWGNRLLARFERVDSGGTLVTRLQTLQAYGQARSLFSRTVAKNGQITPSVNYTRADTILIVMRTGDSTGVASVQAHGHVDGVQLETASLRKARPDSNRTATGVRP